MAARAVAFDHGAVPRARQRRNGGARDQLASDCGDRCARDRQRRARERDRSGGRGAGDRAGGRRRGPPARRRLCRLRTEPLECAPRVEQDLRQALHGTARDPDRAFRRRAFIGAGPQGSRVVCRRRGGQSGRLSRRQRRHGVRRRCHRLERRRRLVRSPRDPRRWNGHRVGGADAGPRALRLRRRRRKSDGADRRSLRLQTCR